MMHLQHFYLFSLCILSAHVFCNDEGEIDQSVNCKYRGVNYKGGEVIPIRDDVCLHCVCRSGWKKPTESSCARIDCPFSAYEDCDAVYSDDQCCPTWKCPDTHQSILV